jgi:hypothetical protein
LVASVELFSLEPPPQDASATATRSPLHIEIVRRIAPS